MSPSSAHNSNCVTNLRPGEFTMGLMSIFGARRDPLYGGGTGTSVEDAVVVNATEASAGIRGEIAFIERLWGTRNRDWKLVAQRLESRDARHFDLVEVERKDGRRRTFCFDITRFFDGWASTAQGEGTEPAAAEDSGEADASAAGRLAAFLRAEGYPCRVDNDGDLHVRYEGGDFGIVFDPRDESFVAVIYPNFWQAESPAERARAGRLALRLGERMKVAKLYLRRDGWVWASAEIFFADPAQLPTLVPRMLKAVKAAAGLFLNEIGEGPGGPGT
jgi:hypothetical protein